MLWVVVLLLLCAHLPGYRHTGRRFDGRRGPWGAYEALRLSDGGAVETTAADAAPAWSGLLDSLRYPPHRLAALKHLVSGEAAATVSPPPLTPGECKTVLAACVEVKSEELLGAALALFQTQGALSSELMYVGIRMALRKKAWALAYKMMLDVELHGLRVDTEAVNGLIQLLSRHGRVAEAMHVLDLAHRKKLGPDAECDIASYFMVISSAARARNADVLVKAFKMMERDPNVEVRHYPLSLTPLMSPLLHS